jgi:two-component system, OmpR family, response regulator QseB
MLVGKQVLIVEEDPVTAVVLRAMLFKLGAAAVVLQEAASAWAALCTQRFDLVFLDLCFGDGAGEALLRELRNAPHTAPTHAGTPVVVMAGRHDLDSRLRLLDAGTDHFVMKPFDLRELQALVRAVFRRRAQAGRVMGRGDLELDPARRACHYRGRLVVLTRSEFDILLCLVRSFPQAVPSSGLLKEGDEGASSATALHVHIHHLRQKLGEETIETVRRVGYRLADGQPADSELQPLAA